MAPRRVSSMFCMQTLGQSDAAPAGCQILYIAFVQCSVTVSYRFQDFISLRQSCMLCVETVMWHFHVTLGSIFARLCHWMDSRNVGGNSVGNFNGRTLNRRTLREQSFPCHETKCNDWFGTRGVSLNDDVVSSSRSRLHVLIRITCGRRCVCVLSSSPVLHSSHGILCKFILIILSTLSTSDMIGLRKWAGLSPDFTHRQGSLFI